MPLALLIGAFGQGNPGDEALLDSAVTMVRGVPGWDAVVATAEPAATSARFDVAVVPPRAGAVARTVTKADALVLAGGTIFKELHPASGRPALSLLRRGLALCRIARARGRPVLMVGVGAAPVRPRALPLVRALASTASLLVLRDDASARLLVDAGVPGPLRVGADLAWRVARRPDGVIAPSRGEIGVAVSHLAGGPDLADTLTARLSPLTAMGWRLVLEPWQGAARLSPDGLVAYEIARRLGDDARVCLPPSDLTEAAERDRHRSAVVALRFHAAVAAAAAGTPFVAVAHEPKLASLAGRFGQPAVAPDGPVDQLATAATAVLSGGGPDAEAVAEERRRADATVELAQLVLAGHGDPTGLEHLALVPAPVPV